MAAFLTAVLSAVLFSCQTVFATEAGLESGSQDTAQTVTLTLDLEGQDKQATIELYQVGAWDGRQGKYVLTDAYADALTDVDLDLEHNTADEIKAASDALAQYVKDHGLQPVASAATEGGKVRFTGLANGLFLVSQGTAVADNVTFSPFLTTLPWMDDITHVWVYDVEGVVKNQTGGSTPPPTPTNPPGGRTPSRPPRGGGNPIGDTPVPLQGIDDDPTPLSNVLEQIEDALTPLAGLLPKTGDRSIAYLPLLLAFAGSGAGIIILSVKRKEEVER